MFILNNLPWFWLAIVILCIVFESLTMSLTTIWFALGAFVMIFLSLTNLSFKWQLLIFVTISLILLISTRPFAMKKLAKKVATNVDSFIGKKVIVTEKITELEKGAIKINGVIWTATSNDNSTIEKDSLCKVVRFEGNTAVVELV